MCSPDIELINFLLENVKMSDKWKRVLSNAIGCEPILICSGNISAQQMKRGLNVSGAIAFALGILLLNEVFVNRQVSAADLSSWHKRWLGGIYIWAGAIVRLTYQKRWYFVFSFY